MHFPLFPISPYFRNIFQRPREIFEFFPFSEKNYVCIRKTFRWPFLVVDSKFEASPKLHTIDTFPSVLGKIISPLLFFQFRPSHRLIYVFSNFANVFVLLMWCSPNLRCVRFFLPPILTTMHLCIIQYTPMYLWLAEVADLAMNCCLAVIVDLYVGLHVGLHVAGSD